MWFLNTPIVNVWFKWVLRIHKDAPKGKPFILLTPSAYHCDNGDGTIFFDCRTHDKFAKRLYYGFYWVWWVFHQWDMVIANSFKPAWNLGFDEFGPLYPEAGEGGGNITSDAATRRQIVNTTWADIRDGVGTHIFEGPGTSWPVRVISGAAVSQWSTLTRYMCTIDTSSIGTTVLDAVFALFIVGKVNDLSATDAHTEMHTVSSAPVTDNDIVIADHTTVGSVSFSVLGNFTTAVISQYNGNSFNTDGINAIDTVSITKLAVILGADFLNEEPNWGAANDDFNFQAHQADASGESKDPKLTGNAEAVVVIAKTMSVRWRFDKGLWSNWVDVSLGVIGDNNPKQIITGLGLGKEIEFEVEHSANQDFVLTHMDMTVKRMGGWVGNA
jgi:hypothetical protein